MIDSGHWRQRWPRHSTHTLELDGAQGEGGGQILRSALTLSMITGQPFRIDHIRARRSRPGLLRQHLTAVQAAQTVCAATVHGATLGSTSLYFAPGRLQGGADYRFAIGTAGSTTLVMQTVLPALWFAEAPSTVLVTGGTHNPAAPPADFLIRSWLPLMRRMGVNMDIELLRHGFFPAGGGQLHARVHVLSGSQALTGLQPLQLEQRGALSSVSATAVCAAVPGDIGRRELERVTTQMGPVDTQLRMLPAGEGPGNVLLLEVAHEQVLELVSSVGEKGLTAEQVSDRAVRELRRYLDSEAAVGEHLADQLVLPLALAGGGVFTTTHLSSHLASNLQLVAKFLPIEVDISSTAGGACRIRMA